MEITPELQAVIDAAIEEATKGLKEKRDQLLKANKELTTAKTAAEQAAEDASEDAIRKAGDIEALETKLNAKHATAIKALEDQLATYRVDAVITKAMVDGGVEKSLMMPLDSMFKLHAKANNLSGDDLAAHIAATLSAPENSNWIAAPVNIGTGATGVKTNTTGHGFTKENFNSRMGEWAVLSASDPAQAKQIAESVGRSDLANSL